MVSKIKEVIDYTPRIQQEAHKRVVGMDDAIELLLTCMYASGHAFFEGVPGTGKTYLCKTIADITDTGFNRIQMTPDLYPRDLWVVTDMSGDGKIEFHDGPIFTNLLLADEINRTSPKVQSSLLEAMGERQVTIGNVTRKLERPFLVVATENPLEQDCTYPLPEAQLDRFLCKIVVGYPTHEESVNIAKMKRKLPPVEKVITGSDLVSFQDIIEEEVNVDDEIFEKAVHLVELTRGENSTLADRKFKAGGSTRAPIAFITASKALAVIRGRENVLPSDLLRLARPILEHRIVFDEDLTPDEYSYAFEEVLEHAVSTVFTEEERYGYAKAG